MSTLPGTTIAVLKGALQVTIWEFQVRSEYGDTKQGGTAGLWSGSVSATAQRNTPPPPNDIRSSPTFDGLQVTWGSVNGSFNVDRFVVIIWDRDT
ncbi:hypothetical protein LTR28_003559 [Elasticomyces elasticus]|nr:hypothetical protein LTR28_003559 [Elasticomyces elasticus]